MALELETVVVGAGVIGLAIARELALQGHEVLVLERHGAVGTETSSRNSEVIHAGLYDPPETLRGRLCIEGRDRLYAYLEGHNVPHRRCGKLLVASDESQLEKLSTIAQSARANGVTDLVELSGDAARLMEPALHCVAALHSPSSGILDVHSYMLSLQGEIEDRGGRIAFNAPLERVERLPDGFLLQIGGREPVRLKVRQLINSAGLSAPSLAHRIEGLDPAFVPRTFFAKGNYFTATGRAPFSRLIYPLPEAAGLGIHLTLDMNGQARFGPDVEWLEQTGEDFNYAVNPERGNNFYESVRRYWPGLKDKALQPAYAGIRPKLHGPDGPRADFVISGPEVHGLKGLVNLFGIESPGLTSSLALAHEVIAKLGGKGEHR